ncbi:glycoside hydrolase family 63 protein [Atractiella rhizophila]|nr:glycoside hydrolase family 63 protein [Atractiella rhizophila]
MVVAPWLVLLGSIGLVQNGYAMDVDEFRANQTLFWGTWKPNLYFGMKSRTANAVSLGLVWWGAGDVNGFSRIRHACRQEDQLATYRWTHHDGRNIASQVLVDLHHNVILSTEVLKVPGGEFGGSWGVRVRGKPVDSNYPSRISLVPYTSIEGLGSLELGIPEHDEGLSSVILEGESPSVGEFTIRIEQGPNNATPNRGNHAAEYGSKLDKFQYMGIKAQEAILWKAPDHMHADIVPGANVLIEKYGKEDLPDAGILFSLSNEVRSQPNFFAFQKILEGAWEVNIFFDDKTSPSKLDGTSLSAGIEAATAAFDKRFEAQFSLSEKGFNKEKVAFARELISSTMGGIGHFYGTSVEDRQFREDWDQEDDDGSRNRIPHPKFVGPNELFTGTPSRSFFPRGFYWDEGFHLLIIGALDNDISLEILRSWIDLVDDDGWVGREQILGDEARSRVPKEFVTQYPIYGNPPTLAMAVTAYISRLRRQGITTGSAAGTDGEMGIDTAQTILTSSSKEHSVADRHVHSASLAQAFLKSIYPKLKRHYEWFRRTQRGQIKEWNRRARSRTEAYRWRGRSMDHVLTSGLDDYPRASPPHVGELHLDLISWMGFFTKTMHEIATFVGEEDDAAELEENLEGILANIDDLHWSEEKKMYCDVSVNEDDESIHVCHQGYISLFPLLLGLLPPSAPQVEHILDLMHDPEKLWSPYGLRSLSKDHPLFGAGENYWKGPVWLPMNYMALLSLYKVYAKEPGVYQQKAATIYSELRNNLIENTFKEYGRTGYAWEQYDALTGEGRRSHPFTGWTALVSLIMAEMYD